MRGDEFTVNYMKQKPEVFKEADITQIIAKLRLFADGYPNFDTFLLDTMKYYFHLIQENWTNHLRDS